MIESILVWSDHHFVDFFFIKTKIFSLKKQIVDYKSNFKFIVKNKNKLYKSYSMKVLN
jgi:hypothetical protein